MIYLLIGTVGRSRFTGVGLDTASPSVKAGDGGDALGGFVGVVVEERHVGKM